MKSGPFIRHARLLPVLMACLATAAQSQTPAAESVPAKVEKAVVRGAQAAASGIQRGAQAAASGVSRGVRAAASGVERGASWVAGGVQKGAQAVQRGASAVSGRVGGAASAPPRQPAPVETVTPKPVRKD